MTGTGTVIGGTIGTIIPGVGTTLGSLLGGAVEGLIGLFGGDKGHWEGDKFIPGDLSNRISTVKSWIYQYGLNESQVDWQVIENILLTPGVWQDRIKTYLTQVKNQKNAINKPLNQPVSQTTQLPYNQTTMPGIQTASIQGLPIITTGLILTGLYMLTKKK